LDRFPDSPRDEYEGGASFAPPSSARRAVPVWDIAVRIFHWSLVLAVAVAWLSGGTGSRIHEITGFTVAGLIAFRLLWGFAGTRHAKFKDFVRSPFAVLRYLRTIGSPKSERHLGHNPAGGAMILFLLALLILIAATGYMQMTPRFFGVPWVEDLHHYAANTLVAIIPLHLIGVLVSSLLHRENLLGAMLTGNKRAHDRALPTPLDREQHLLHHIRASQGLLMLTLLAGGSASYGVWATSHRSAVVPVEDKIIDSMQPPQMPPASSDTAAAGPVRPPGRERQDYATGGPDLASRAWMLSSGGRLYDRWYGALDVTPPQTTHPSWPAENRNLSGPETWRCKTCHGWDYLGREGQYASGPSASDAPSLMRAKNRTIEDIMLTLAGDKHRFTDGILSQDAKFRIALFLREGLHVARNHIDRNGKVRGNPALGKAMFENVCAACHGFDGRQRKLGVSADPVYRGEPMYVGTKTATNPIEVLHKIRNGHPGAIMVSMRAFPMETAVNILAYAQTLPPR
jgi:cytochrome b